MNIEDGSTPAEQTMSYAAWAKWMVAERKGWECKALTEAARDLREEVHHMPGDQRFALYWCASWLEKRAE